MTEQEKVRFTAWFTAAERDGISRVAKDWGVSANFIVRVAIQHLLEARPAKPVTVVTRNHKEGA